MLQKISFAQPDHRGFKHNLRLYDNFEFKGPHGNHLCIVTEVLGFSLDYVQKLNNEHDPCMTLPLVRRFAKQILYGLEYLYTVCGIIHTGMFFTSSPPHDLSDNGIRSDLKHDNILFRPSDVPSVVGSTLVIDPSICYYCDTSISPQVVPVVSQPLQVTIKEVLPTVELKAMIADVGHCMLSIPIAEHILMLFTSSLA
jgi:serine/threonine-protein kinase SRPK3